MSTEKIQTAWPDPAKAATDVYKMVMENDRVRVFEVRFKPGQSTVMHGHPDHVVYVLADYTLDLMLPDGTSQKVPSRQGRPSGLARGLTQRRTSGGPKAGPW